jgi:hemoglobin
MYAGCMSDVCSRQDIALVVDTFYNKATQDETIGYLFEGLDLLNHLPTIHDFWENILFRTGAYKGGMMYKHFALNARKPLEKKHFERWLGLFTQTVEEQFAGPNAELMKQFCKSQKYRLLFVNHRRVHLCTLYRVYSKT